MTAWSIVSCERVRARVSDFSQITWHGPIMILFLLCFLLFFGAKPTSITGVRVRSHDNHDSHPSEKVGSYMVR